METRTVYPLEIRQSGRTIKGRFQYGSTATMSDRGKARKERFAPRAFSYAVDDPEREIHLLAGHSFDRPLASKRGGTLELEDTAEGLSFSATLPEEGEMPTYMVDMLKQIRAGLVGGVSPGFRVPPASAVSNAEELIPEPGNAGVLIRQVNQAVLFELSLVTRPAYPETDVEMRRLVERERHRGGRLRRWL